MPAQYPPLNKYMGPAPKNNKDKFSAALKLLGALPTPMGMAFDLEKAGTSIIPEILQDQQPLIDTEHKIIDKLIEKYDNNGANMVIQLSTMNPASPLFRQILQQFKIDIKDVAEYKDAASASGKALGQEVALQRAKSVK